MGVPQTRHRVFFIGVRNDIDFDFEELNMTFNYEPVKYCDIEMGEHKEKKGVIAEVSKFAKYGEGDLRNAAQRHIGRIAYFGEAVLWKDRVCPTIKASGGYIRVENKGYIINEEEIVNAQTFPQDYDFLTQNKKYICGMSVPPVMIKRIATRLIGSGIFGRML